MEDVEVENENGKDISFTSSVSLQKCLKMTIVMILPSIILQLALTFHFIIEHFSSINMKLITLSLAVIALSHLG